MDGWIGWMVGRSLKKDGMVDGHSPHSFGIQRMQMYGDSCNFQGFSPFFIGWVGNIMSPFDGWSSYSCLQDENPQKRF